MLKELNKELQQSEVRFFPPDSPWLFSPRARKIFLFVGSQAFSLLNVWRSTFIP